MPTDFPLIQLMATAHPLIRAGADIYFKWTCVACGDRVVADNANTFTDHSQHSTRDNGEKCGYVTPTHETGGNYLCVHTAESYLMAQRAEQLMEAPTDGRVH